MAKHNETKHRRKGALIKLAEKKYRIKLFIGYDAKGTAKYIQETLNHCTCKDADKRLAEIITEFERGTFKKAELKLKTLNELLDEWLKVKKAVVTERTFDDYESKSRLYIRPKLGKKQITEVTAFDVQMLYLAIQQNGLGARTVRYVHTVLQAAFEKAVEWEFVTRNPTRGASLPKLESKERRVFSEAEAQRFLTTLDGDPFATMILFAMDTATRPEEFFAVQWKDLHAKERFISIQRAVVRPRRGGGWRFAETKNKSSRRQIRLLPQTLAALESHRRQQDEVLTKMGAKYEDHDLIFATKNGTPFMLSNFHRAFKKALAKTGFPSSIRPYDLRHSCATVLMAKGNPAKVISERLGHSSALLTMNIYSHVSPDMQREAALSLENSYFPKTRNTLEIQSVN